MIVLIDPWLPQGVRVGDMVLGRPVQEGEGWQIYDANRQGTRVLVARQGLAERWMARALLPEGALVALTFGGEAFECISSTGRHVLCALQQCRMPGSEAAALSFAASLRRTRKCEPEASLGDGIYVERFSVILPVYALSAPMSDELVVGRYLTGGVPVSARSTRRLASIVSWLPPDRLAHICGAAGVGVGLAEAETRAPNQISAEYSTFSLPGRPELEAFFQEHVIDIIQNPERYSALGISFPGAVVLHGPPGTGKTFAVERLVDFLGWPSFDISSSSIGSPYIHETGRKVGEVFRRAAAEAPAVVIIDEMEAFLTDRASAEGSAPHRVEEVAEFLRCIPEAAQNRVLVVAMTNRLDTVDEALLRRGRFDHIIEVAFASTGEVQALLKHLLSDLPHSRDIDPAELSRRLAGRPLSDVAFVLREAGRLAARSGKGQIDMTVLEQACAATPSRDESRKQHPIGFGR